MNTQENNKMIAEFMGAIPIVFSDGTKGHSFWNYDFDGEGRYGSFPDGATNYFDYDKGYHTSWDWLMPVVEKIESLGYEFFIVEDRVKVSHNTDHSIETIIDLTFGGSKRDATYQGVVEFINQLNK